MRSVLAFAACLAACSISCVFAEENAPQKAHCACVDCACKPDAHCGCYSDQGCHCAPGAQCLCTENCPAADKSQS